jgi:hypothetical protein
VPRRHIIRKLLPSYTALYKSRSGNTIVVRSLTPLPEKRKFKAFGGLRTYTKVREKYHLQEVIIMAKAAKKGKTAVVTDDELEELEGIEELEDLEEEDEELEEPEDELDEDDDEDDEDEDEDEEEEPVKKAKKPRQSRAAANGFVGTQELAEDLGVSSRELRMVLRKLREKDDVYKPDAETGRYQWKSLKDPQVKKIKKAIDSGLHKKIRDESLERLKQDQAAKKAAKSKDASTKTKKGKKKRQADDE